MRGNSILFVVSIYFEQLKALHAQEAFGLWRDDILDNNCIPFPKSNKNNGESLLSSKGQVHVILTSFFSHLFSSAQAS